MPDRPDSRGAESPEMWRWQGAIDQAMEDHRRRLDAINGDAKAARTAAEKTLVEVAVIRTKVALYSTVGSLVGAGVVSAAVALLTRGGSP